MGKENLVKIIESIIYGVPTILGVLLLYYVIKQAINFANGVESDNLIVKLLSMINGIKNYILKTLNYLWNEGGKISWKYVGLILLPITMFYILIRIYKTYGLGIFDFLENQKFTVEAIMVFIGVCLALLVNIHFISFGEKSGLNNYKMEPGLKENTNWLKGTVMKIVKPFFQIMISILITVFLGKYLLENVLSNKKPLSLLMTVLGLALLSNVYNLLIKNEFIKKLLEKPILSFLFNLILFIPCLINMTISSLTTFLRNERLMTNPLHLKLLMAQVSLVIMVVIAPMIQTFLYKFVKADKDKNDILQKKINTVDTTIDELEVMVSNMKSYKNNASKRLSDNAWDHIIKNNLYIRDNEDPYRDFKLKTKLKEFLVNNSYIDGENECINSNSDSTLSKTLIEENCKKEINDLIYYIRDNTEKIIRIETKLNEMRKIKIRYSADKKVKVERGKIMVREPININMTKNIGEYLNLDNNTTSFDYKYNYCLSCWFFIHAQPPNFNKNYNKNNSIINYNNKPNIAYNMKKEKLVIIMGHESEKDEGDGRYKISEIDDVLLQKWNNVVVNYVDGVLDIFVNGELKETINNVLPNMNFNRIFSGTDGGITGGICNVTYYPRSIPLSKIKTNYNLLKNKNPPIV
tara:strand:- start:712 stop:2616 length:1905 start_codon:yes stop_codon:yes gene_type:complete